MVEVVNSLEDLCRLCAGKIDVLMGLNIFASDHRQIFKKICVCLPIQVSVDDSFPKMVCVECACKLDLMFDFRERSILTAHLFSDMMTVNSGNQIIPADQSIQIASVAGEHDFNGDFITCKLEGVKYDNQLTTEMCSTSVPPPPPPSTSNENILNQESITLHESQDILSKCKAEDKGRVSRKKLKEVVEISVEHQQEMDKMENERTPKVYSQQQQQQQQQQQEQQQQLSQGGDLTRDLTGNLTSKDLSTEKLEVDSMLGPSEGNHNLNDCTNLEWFFCASCNRTFEDRESYDTHTHEDVKCGGDDDEEDNNEVNGDGGVEADEPNNDVSTLELEPNKKKKTKEKKTGKGEVGAGGCEKRGEGKVCLECGKEYQTNYKLQEHMRKHTGEKPFSCSYEGCKKAFRSKIGLAQHEANHSGQYEFSCNTCGKGFQCKSYLVVHQRVHSDVKPFVCKQCSRKFKTKQSLLDHMNRHLGVKPFLCDICGRGFITKGLCKSHQKVHSGTDNRQYPCHVCRKLFVSKSYLNTHFRIHTGEKPFMCEVCGKGFLTRVDLRIHSTMHTGEKSFVCEMCGKAFARRDALRCHRRSHTGERPYKCEFCGQSFTQFSPMAIHKRLHTGERPYECDVCSKTFVSRSTMLTHRKKHHASNNEDSQFRFASVEVQQNEMNGHSNEPSSDELVVIEDSPQLLLALSKRHPSVVSQSPPANFPPQVHKLKNENPETGVPTE